MINNIRRLHNIYFLTKSKLHFCTHKHIHTNNIFNLATYLACLWKKISRWKINDIWAIKLIFRMICSTDAATHSYNKYEYFHFQRKKIIMNEMNKKNWRITRKFRSCFLPRTLLAWKEPTWDFLTCLQISYRSSLLIHSQRILSHLYTYCISIDLFLSSNFLLFVT